YRHYGPLGWSQRAKFKRTAVLLIWDTKSEITDGQDIPGLWGKSATPKRKLKERRKAELLRAANQYITASRPTVNKSEPQEQIQGVQLPRTSKSTQFKQRQDIRNVEAQTEINFIDIIRAR
ncbi:hypothetical protein CHS0354_030908, partial [Potamilus streckersoni]